MATSILILDTDAITRALRRIAHEILEHNPDPGAFALIGIPSRGVELARRLADLVRPPTVEVPSWARSISQCIGTI
jgi:pyrimidine operon attenuation protein/uracil phosphoribosyltransferase